MAETGGLWRQDAVQQIMDVARWRAAIALEQTIEDSKLVCASRRKAQSCTPEPRLDQQETDRRSDFLDLGGCRANDGPIRQTDRHGAGTHVDDLAVDVSGLV